MRKTLNKNQLERMIAGCVSEVLSESNQKRTQNKGNRVVMNESQLKNFIAKVINEEVENEGMLGGFKQMWNGRKNGKGVGQNFTNGYVGDDISKAAGLLEKQKDYLMQTGMQNVDFIIKTLYDIAKGTSQKTNQLRNEKGRFGKHYNVDAKHSNGLLSKMKQSYDNWQYGVNDNHEQGGNGYMLPNREPMSNRYFMGRY